MTAQILITNTSPHTVTVHGDPWGESSPVSVTFQPGQTKEATFFQYGKDSSFFMLLEGVKIWKFGAPFKMELKPEKPLNPLLPLDD
jgi:hypothetical protein